MLKEKYIEKPEDLESEKVFIEFYAPRCAYCRAAEPTVQKLSDEFPEIEFIKVNTDEHPKAAESFSIRALPTFVVLSGKTELGRLTGAKPAADLRELVSTLL